MLAGLTCMDLKRDAWKTRYFICVNTVIVKDNSIILNALYIDRNSTHQNINQRKIN